jgi:hypothetical protein
MNLIRVSTWFRAATQRLHAARVLFSNSMYIDATYLGGYVTECAVKGYLLARVPERRRRRFIEERFRGAKAHDFVFLSWLATVNGARLPHRIIKGMRTIAWSSDLRYAVGLGDSEEAAEVIRIGEEVLIWARSNA